MIERRRVVGGNGEKNYSREYLTVKVKSGSPKIYCHNAVVAIYYSTDGNSWNTLSSQGNIFNANDIIFLKATYIDTNNRVQYLRIQDDGSVELYGNPLSLVYGDSFTDYINSAPPVSALAALFDGSVGCEIDASNLVIPEILSEDCCRAMFGNCKGLVVPPKLPATTLEKACYNYMFSGCTSLTTAPELPATTLGTSCYYEMFSGCTSLTTAPLISDATGGSTCYVRMFYGCTRLKYIKYMGLTAPSNVHNQDWVKGVASFGTFIKNSAATWTHVYAAYGIPSGWTVMTANS